VFTTVHSFSTQYNTAYLQTNITAQMLSIGGEEGSELEERQVSIVSAMQSDWQVELN